nr:LapA family protein [Rhodoferax sp.]
MKQLVWFFKWMLKAAIFFTLFAFALNNQHDATVRFFFGQQWTAPLVLVVLIAFALGLVIGVLGMVPRWWQHRRAAALARRQAAAASAATPAIPEKPVLPQQPPYGI